jgi:uncharacterized protein
VIEKNNKKPLPSNEPCPCCGQWWAKVGSTPNEPIPSHVPAVPDKGWIQLPRSGERFYFRDSRNSSIHLEDIAAMLSQMPMHPGVRKFYSVAEHCCRVAGLVPPEHQLQALLYRACDALLGNCFPAYRQISDERRIDEEVILQAVYARFKLPAELHASVKSAGYRVTASEVPLLFGTVDEGWKGWLTGHRPIEDMTVDSIGWSPDDAERAFLELAQSLWETHRKQHRQSYARHIEPVNTVRGRPLTDYYHLASAKD